MKFLVHHMLRASADRCPDREALVHRDQRLSYSEMVTRTTALAKGLRQIGVQRGDRIGIFLEASVSQVISMIGTSQAGGVFVPINNLLFPDQAAYIAKDCAMTALVTTASKLPALASKLESIPSLRFLIVVEEGDNDLSNVSCEIYNFGELCEMGSEVCHDVVISSDLAAILYTSGSTGKPKGVMLSHAQIMAGSSIVSDYLEITHDDRILAVLPFSFDAGLNQLMTAFHQGGTLVLINFVFATEIVDVLINEQITGLAGVPTLWGLLRSSLTKHRFPCLRYVTNTGGAMPQPVLKTMRAALPKTRIFLMYGLTEAFRSTYLPPEELDRRPTSMGKAIPDTEILVINDKGQLCQPGEVGELVHRGPTVSIGYWGQPQLTAKVLRPHPLQPSSSSPNERVCYSGDLVKTDADGFLYFVGRRDAMIKSSGYRISPTEVEEILFESKQLQEVAVVGVADELLGQSVKAFIVPRDEETVNTAALLAFCAERMPRYMIPQSIEIMDRIPKTTSGKIDYAALREREG